MRSAGGALICCGPQDTARGGWLGWGGRRGEDGGGLLAHCRWPPQRYRPFRLCKNGAFPPRPWGAHTLPEARPGGACCRSTAARASSGDGRARPFRRLPICGERGSALLAECDLAQRCRSCQPRAAANHAQLRKLKLLSYQQCIVAQALLAPAVKFLHRFLLYDLSAVQSFVACPQGKNAKKAGFKRQTRPALLS
jgi:hypothetical protein